VAGHEPHAPSGGEIAPGGANGVAVARGGEVDPPEDDDVVGVGHQCAGFVGAHDVRECERAVAWHIGGDPRMRQVDGWEVGHVHWRGA